MARAGRSLTATDRYRKRWHTSPAPRSNVVNPMQFVAERTDQPDAPCMRCGARSNCRHRELVDA